MATSIAEAISQDIEATLNTVKLVAGYSFDFVVERADKLNYPADGTCVIDMEAPERDTEGCLGHDTWFLNYVITVYVAVSDAWEQTIAERLGMAYADAYRALMADPHRNAMALNSEMGSPTPDNGDGGLASIDIPLKVHYRHLSGRPSEL